MPWIPRKLDPFPARLARIASAGLVSVIFAAICCAPMNAGTRKEIHESPNALQVMVNAPLTDVVEAVQQVAGDTVVYGTQSYQREKNLLGARRAESSKAF